MINIQGLELNQGDVGFLKTVLKQGEDVAVRKKNKLGCGIGKEGGLEITRAQRKQGRGHESGWA